MRAERRQHERIRIRAEARLAHGGRETLLEARDLSLGGAFLAGDGLDGVEVADGHVVELTLLPDEDAPYHAEDGDGAIVHLSARVVRHDERGVAVAFERVDAENSARLRALVEDAD